MIQALLPIFPEEVTRINEFLAFQKKDGHVYYFNATMPIFSHHEDDLASFRLITSQLYINGNCKQREIVDAFGVSSNSVKRYVKRYREKGMSGLLPKAHKRKPRILTAQVIQQAQEMFNEGLTRSEVSKALELKPDTLYKAVRSGKLVEPGTIKKKMRVRQKAIEV